MKTIEQNLPAVNNAEYQPKLVENEIKLSISASQALYKTETNNILNETLSGEVLKNSQAILSQGKMELELGGLLNRFNNKNNSITSAPQGGEGLTTKLGGPFIDTRIAA